MNIAEKKSKVDFADDIMGIFSVMYIECKSKIDYCYPLTFHSSKDKMILTKGRYKKNVDRNKNKMSILPPFIISVGPGEMDNILSIFSLPNIQYYQHTIFRREPLVCTQIIKISDREMQYTMEEEIKVAIISKKG